AQERLASQVAPAPALPPLAVEAIIHAPGAVSSLALDAHTHTLVAQIAPEPCAPTPLTTHCGAPITSQSGLAFYDSATGALRSQSLWSPSDTAHVLTDTTHGATYIISSGSVTIYSDATGKQADKYSSSLDKNLQSAALDGRTGMIYTVSDSDIALNAFDAATGQQVASAPLPPPSAGGTLGSEIRVDESAGRVYVYNDNAMNPTLYAFNASDLTPLGSWRLPGRGGSLGALDAATHTLYLGVSQLDLTTLPADGAGEQVSAEQTIQSAMLRGASHFGVDSATGALVLMTETGIEVYAANSVQPYAALPLVRASSISATDVTPWLLPIDTISRLAYAPGDDNTILIVSLAPPTGHAAPNLLTAEVMARAAMAKLLPDTNQNPPFISAETFPIGTGTVERQYFIHYSDLGWKGPYAGTASVSGVKAGATAGDYTMTFSITWNQLFLRQHSWTVEVTPDRRVHLMADSGDAIP
ncbi:MAG TPA: hypothetical protein VFN78_10625, partial [Ktedonobacterales bacterium]|nr:hypothetical protein [Ktedonobacterales bacterium]